MSPKHPRGVGLQTSFVLLALGAVLCAQAPDPQPSQTPTFRSRADLTVVDAVVTDGDGNHVTDLTADDFEVYQDGERQVLQQVLYIRAGADGSAQPAPLASTRAPGAVTTGSAPAGPRSRFAAALGLPPDKVARTIALVVDDLGLSFESTFTVRNALHKYIDTQIADGDLVAIIRTSGGVGALQQFTTDKRLLHKAADRIQWTIISRKALSPFGAVTSATFVSRGVTGQSPIEAGSDRGTDPDNTLDGLRDSMLASASMASIEFIVRGAQQLPGRKSLILFSEGVDVLNRMGSARTWSAMGRMLTMANRAGVVVYTVDARGLQTGGLVAEDDPSVNALGEMSPAAFNSLITERVRNAGRDRRQELLNTQESLQFIAAQTGGFAVMNTNDLNLGIRRILDDQRGYYLLGYASKERPTGRWEQGQVTVKVNRKGLRVRARAGVYGPASPDVPREQIGEPMLMAALSPFGAGDVTVRLTSLFNYEKTGESYIRSLLFIDPEGLTFTQEADGSHAAQAEAVVLAVADNGQIAGQLKQALNLRLAAADYQRARTAGLVYHTRLLVKSPGAYQVRSAVRDVASGRIGSASQFLEVPTVGRGRLAVSGVLLQDKDSLDPGSAVQISPTNTVLGAPTIRIYHPGSDVVFAYEVYDGLPPDARDALAMSTALVRDGKVLYESAPAPIKAPAATDPLRVIPIGGMLSLGADVPPGTYSLEVRVARKDKPRQVAAQWTDFEVRKR